MAITNIMQHWKYLGGMSLQTILKEPLENIQYMFVCVDIKIRRVQHMTIGGELFSQSHNQITGSGRGQFSVPQGSNEDILAFSKHTYLHFLFTRIQLQETQDLCIYHHCISALLSTTCRASQCLLENNETNIRGYQEEHLQ